MFYIKIASLFTTRSLNYKTHIAPTRASVKDIIKYVIKESYLNRFWIGYIFLTQCVPNLLRISEVFLKKNEIRIFAVLLYMNSETFKMKRQYFSHFIHSHIVIYTSIYTQRRPSTQ